MEKLLSRLSPYFYTVLQKNIEFQLQSSLLCPRSMQILSNFSPHIFSNPLSAFKDVHEIFTQNPDFKQFTVRLTVNNLPAGSGLSNWEKEMSYLPKGGHDIIYLSYFISDDVDGNVYEIHKQSNQWWRKFINKPLNLKQTIQPNSCEINYHPNMPGMSDSLAESHVVERTWVENVSSDFKTNTKSLICNIKSTKSCLYTILIDSFSSVDNYEFLMLHHKLTPIQTSIVVNIDSSISDNVDAIKDEILTDLLHENITFELNGDNFSNTVFLSNDMRGIPFSIILNNETVSDGIAYIRDRNTHFIEPINYKSVVNYLKLNLQFRA